MLTRSTRRGFTLVEVLVVMAILLLLAAVVLPSIGAFRGDSRPRAAADVIRGELATARGRAMLESRPYRIAIGANGTRIRRAPDGPEFAETAAFEHADGGAAVVEYAFDYVTAELLSDPSAASDSGNGWTTIAVVLPNGTCLDDNIIVGVREDSGSPLRIQIRGLTGTSRVLPAGTEAR
ncbi:prepilin-type N-terminal cleavage/methylation domain-containing protein [Gemmata sp. G18]|uniref:Prepilin-type N-terminal cleavage/methylation domain-containing protein n=1 Tax=Gemmata palustris TaxID=2822762 RepID=A0ABS5C1D4_9BACT|nr:prepilin-type N-terminal cleavage/methylation domain-containing protein [Gemmata palustris]MBP3959472.1 prepilin-type N-terminal cleavage/methylation domain-containing protein [Gemmata palustris]